MIFMINGDKMAPILQASAPQNVIQSHPNQLIPVFIIWKRDDVV